MEASQGLAALRPARCGEPDVRSGLNRLPAAAARFTGEDELDLSYLTVHHFGHGPPAHSHFSLTLTCRPAHVACIPWVGGLRSSGRIKTCSTGNRLPGFTHAPRGHSKRSAADGAEQAWPLWQAEELGARQALASASFVPVLADCWSAGCHRSCQPLCNDSIPWTHCIRARRK